jgi:hypothetical protein
MIRGRAPVWLSGPGRFATLRPAHAMVVALLIALALLSIWVAPGIDPVDSAVDSDIPAVLVQGVRAGVHYYAVTAQALRAGELPLHPFTAFRLPTLTMVQAALPDWLSVLLFAAVALATALAWQRRIFAWFTAPAPRIAAMILLAAGIVAVVHPGLVRSHDVWAGLLVAWSLAIRRDDRWVEAAAIGLCAMLIREMAALYPLAMLAAALIDRRRREAAGWGVTLLVFVGVLSLHARAAGLVTGPLDAGAVAGDGLHGLSLFATAVAESSVAGWLPWWIGAPVALLALAGWASAPGPVGLRAALTFGGTALVIAIVARSGDGAWVLVIAPAYMIGLAFLPDAIRDLARGLLDRRRVRVQRITR